MHLKPMGIPGVCPKHVRAWTSEHDEFLIKNYSVLEIADIAALLNRTVTAIESRSRVLRNKGISVPYRSKNRPLTLSERRFIQDNRHAMTAPQIAAYLNRHEVTIKRIARKMGLSLQKLGDYHHSVRYSDEDVHLIRALRESENPMTFREIGEKFEISSLTAQYLCSRRATAEDTISREYLSR